MATNITTWKTFLLFIKRKLQELAILLELLWIFFPGILFILLSAFLFTRLLQGKDLIILALESSVSGFYLLTGLIFWSGVSWYTGRLIAYNHDKLFEKASRALYHAPRVMGFLCFTVLIYAFLKLPEMNTPKLVPVLVIAVDLLVYYFFHRLFERFKDRESETVLNRYRNIVLVILLILFFIAGYVNQAMVYLLCLPLMQLGFLFLVIIRRKITETDIIAGHGFFYRTLNWILTDESGTRSAARNQMILKGEWNIFKWFNVSAIIAITIYLLAIFNLTFSRILSPLPFALLAFGILLGAGNIIALLSTKTKINFHFILIVLVFAVGLLAEPHNVRVNKSTHEPELIYGKRQDLHAYFNQWVAVRQKEIEDSSNTIYPVFFALADGGASRSGYWTASVLSRLQDGTAGKFSRHLFCLSGASGGSVGNASFYASLYAKKYNGNGQSNLYNSQSYLSNDFLSYTLARMMGPDFFKPLFPFDSIYDRAAALEISMESVPGDNTIAPLMAKPLSYFLQNDQADGLPVLCINTTRMQDGRPGVVSTIQIDSTIFGRRLDVLKTLKEGEDLNLSTLAVLGARFPYVSPAGRIRNNYFVDGGYFDNSGAGVVHEMIIELQRMVTDSLQKDASHFLSKLRFFVIHTTNSPIGEAEVSKVHPLINDLAAPVKTLIGSYNNQTIINNLRLFKYLLQINGGDTTYIPFNLYLENEKDLYPMNWVISKSNRLKMDRRLDSYQKIDRFIEVINKNDFERIHHLFKD